MSVKQEKNKKSVSPKKKSAETKKSGKTSDYSAIKGRKYLTLSPKNHDFKPKWYSIDAKGKCVGRLASQIVGLLSGKKNTPFYAPHLVCGHRVVVLNADQVVFTGKKEKNKQYMWYTGYPGGQRTRSVAEERAKHPTRILERSVLRMLPKNKLRKLLFKNLYLCKGTEHGRKEKLEPLTSLF